MNRKPQYLACPNFDIPPPPDGPIQLGHIVADLDDPCNALNWDSRINILNPADKPTIFHSKVHNFRATREQLRDAKVGIWANFLSGIGFGSEASYQFDKKGEDEYTFDLVETHYFNPTIDYYQKSLKKQDVQAYFSMTSYRKPVYMITGMKIVRGGRVETTDSKGHKVVAKLGFQGAAVGVPGSLGPEVEFSTMTSNSTSFDASSDFVLAIRLKKLTCKRDGRVRDENFTKGAMFGLESTGADGIDDIVIEVDENDADPADFDAVETALFSDGDGTQL